MIQPPVSDWPYLAIHGRRLRDIAPEEFDFMTMMRARASMIRVRPRRRSLETIMTRMVTGDHCLGGVKEGQECHCQITNKFICGLARSGMR